MAKQRMGLVIIVLVLLIVSYVFAEHIIRERVSHAKSLIAYQSFSTERESIVFVEDFERKRVIEETGEMKESLDQHWWLNSGGTLTVKNGVGRTIHGALPKTSLWRRRFAASKPDQTDNGYHPQNIFRLLSRTKKQDVKQEVYFKITEDNLSKSQRRNASNGVFLMNRYKDGNNLYYVGLRVDGAAVIKKKVHGRYHTIAYKPVFRTGTYHRIANPNLIPHNQWIGLKSVVKSVRGGKVVIRVYIDANLSRKWSLVMEAKDDAASFGGPAILNSGYTGIRTDFMDVQFDNYIVERN